MIDTEISIDRLTVVGYDAGGFADYLKYSGYITSKGFSSNYGFRYSYKGLQGELIEIGDKGKVRIDFNPNKANMKQIEDMFSRLKYPHLTRMDIAVDYFDLDLSNVEWSDTKHRKRNYWVDGYQSLETLYIGAPSSDKRFRIYDKLKERKENGHGEWEKDWEFSEVEEKQYSKHWRVEVQKRFKERDNILDPKDYFLHDLFDIRPVAKYLDLSHIEKHSERVSVAGYLARPDLLKDAPRNSRPKYKKLIQEAQERAGKVLEIEPHEVYEKEKSHLIGKLDGLMSNCFKPMRLA